MARLFCFGGPRELAPLGRSATSFAPVRVVLRRTTLLLKTLFSKHLVVCVAFFLTATGWTCADEAIPSNYNQIKNLLDQYTGAFDIPISKAADSARSTLYLHADEAAPALMLLFRANTSNHYRYDILNILDKAHSSQASITPFLADQLDKVPDPYQGEGWVMRASEMLAKNAPEKAVVLARKWIVYRSAEMHIVALDTFGVAGSKEDVVTINNYTKSLPSEASSSSSAFSAFMQAADKAKAAIVERQR